MNFYYHLIFFPFFKPILIIFFYRFFKPVYNNLIYLKKPYIYLNKVIALRQVLL